MTHTHPFNADRRGVPQPTVPDQVAADADGDPQAVSLRRPVLPQLLLTPEEAAQALRISRSKLYELLCSGAVESVRIDRLRRIPVRALHEYVERLRGV